MAQLETFAAYFARLITVEAVFWISSLMVVSYLFKKPWSRALGISANRFLVIALAFAGVIGLSLRFWEAHGTISTFWLVAPELWSTGLAVNANFVLNVCLYVPPAALLVLARKSWWKVWAFLASWSFLTETIQQYLRIGAGDPFDWLANFSGALLGVVIGLSLQRLFPTMASSSTAARRG
jgi:glycopeptide antibiotics resistance protein